MKLIFLIYKLNILTKTTSIMMRNIEAKWYSDLTTSLGGGDYENGLKRLEILSSLISGGDVSRRVLNIIAQSEYKYGLRAYMNALSILMDRLVERSLYIDKPDDVPSAINQVTTQTAKMLTDIKSRVDVHIFEGLLSWIFTEHGYIDLPEYRMLDIIDGSQLQGEELSEHLACEVCDLVEPPPTYVDVLQQIIVNTEKEIKSLQNEIDSMMQ